MYIMICYRRYQTSPECRHMENLMMVDGRLEN